MSPTWYTYLEQARDVSPSREVLDSLAGILGLSDYERVYLHNLSRHTPPLAERSAQRSVAVENLTRVVESLSPLPAYLCSQLGDLLAWNDEAIDWFGDFTSPAAPQLNFLLWMFTAKTARDRFVDWQDQARHLVARLRADALDCYDTARIRSLVHDLTETSPHFRRWWDEHAVDSHGLGQCTIRHPRHGTITMRRIYLAYQSAPEPLKLVIHMPVNVPREGYRRTTLPPRPELRRVSTR